MKDAKFVNEKVQQVVNYLGYMVNSFVRSWQPKRIVDYGRIFEGNVRELESS